MKDGFAYVNIDVVLDPVVGDQRDFHPSRNRGETLDVIIHDSALTRALVGSHQFPHEFNPFNAFLRQVASHHLGDASTANSVDEHACQTTDDEGMPFTKFRSVCFRSFPVITVDGDRDHQPAGSQGDATLHARKMKRVQLVCPQCVFVVHDSPSGRRLRVSSGFCTGHSIKNNKKALPCQGARQGKRCMWISMAMMPYLSTNTV